MSAYRNLKGETVSDGDAFTPAADLAAYEWRAGGHGDCGILAMTGYDRDADPVLGLMNTAVLAAAVVDEHNAAIRDEQDGRDAREALSRIDGLPKRWGAPLAHEVDDAMGAAAWAAVGSEAHLIAHRALGGGVESARAQLAPRQDIETPEPTLGSQKGPAPT